MLLTEQLYGAMQIIKFNKTTSKKTEIASQCSQRSVIFWTLACIKNHRPYQPSTMNIAIK